MKLYMNAASTTCRPIMLFAAENNIDLEMEVVDLMSGEHLQDKYKTVNPNCLVPCLEDGDFRLTESSAILKYLADKFETPDYPKDLQQRARVNERMDWFNANMYKDFGYNLIYPQLFPHHKRPSEAAHDGAIEWGRSKTRHWLAILDQNILAGNKYLCGNQMTIADYFGACLIELGVVIRYDYSAYPNLQAWMGRMRALDSWNEVHKVIYGFAKSMEGQTFKAA